MTACAFANPESPITNPVQLRHAFNHSAKRRLQRRRPLVAGKNRPHDRAGRAYRLDRPQRRRQIDLDETDRRRAQARRWRSARATGCAHRAAGAGGTARDRRQRVRRGGRWSGRVGSLAGRIPSTQPCRGVRRRCVRQSAGQDRCGRRVGAGSTRHRDADQAGTGWRCGVRAAVWRYEATRAFGAFAGVLAGCAAAGRTDQPSGYRSHRLAGNLPEGLERQRAVRHPRPALPACVGHPHRRDRSRPGHQLAGRLGQLRAPPRGTAQCAGAGECALRQVAGAGRDLDPSGHQGPAHPRRGPRAAPGIDAQRARAAARAHRQRAHGSLAGRVVRQEGDRGQGGWLRVRCAHDGQGFFHHHPAWRPHRPDRPQR